MRRLLLSLGLAALGVTLVPAPAHAQQSVSFHLGEFAPADLGSRDVNDVLLNDTAFLNYNFSSFSAFTFGGDWLVALGDKAEAGLGAGYYEHSEPAVDAFSVFDQTGAPIAAELRLRTVPFAATVRFLPFGHRNNIQPYIGGGITVIAWKYSEAGNFVSTDGETIVAGKFEGSGAAVGPLFLGGIRFPAGPMSVGFEVRYQNAEADLPTDQGFAAATPTSQPKIDLEGWSYLATFGLKF
jgi:opacity protein-like surface antigen